MIFLTPLIFFVSTVQEQGADETSGCPLERKKVWPDRKFTAAALTIGQPAGNNTERLHCFNTVKVSLLCFLIAINIDYFLIGKARDHVVHGKINCWIKEKPFSKCRHILDILWQLFHWIMGCDFGMEDGALVFFVCLFVFLNTAGPKQKSMVCVRGWHSVDSVYPLHFYGCHAIYLFNSIS